MPAQAAVQRLRDVPTSNGVRRLATLAILACSFGAGCKAPHARTQFVYYPKPGQGARAVHLISFNALRDVVSTTPTFVEVIRGGGVSPFVHTPAGIDYHNGRLYICDTGKGIVHTWDLELGHGGWFGAGGESALATPVDVTVDENGTAFVADTGRGAVISFDSAGSQTAGYRIADVDAYRPVAVAVQNGKLYAADVARHKIDVFDTSTGNLLSSLGRPGSETGALYYPTGLALDRSGQLVVSEMLNARVQVLDDAGRPVRHFGQPGNRYGDMGKPKHVAVGPDGVVYVADAEFERVHLFNDEGRLLMLLGRGENYNAGILPLGVCIASDVPPTIAKLVPADFAASYYLFVTSSTGDKRISLYAIGRQR